MQAPTPPEPRGEDDGTVVILETDAAEPGLDVWIADHLAKALDQLDQSGAPITVVVVDDPAMIQLHQQYHQLDTTTDVLTFDLRDDPSQPIEGDIVVCLDEATRQARLRGHAIREELLLYVVHGLMHLLGEDDHDDAAYRQMHKREDDLLEAMGLGRLFERGAEADAGKAPGSGGGLP